MTGTVEVNYRVEGVEDAPALIMSNSLGTTLGMWDDQAPALSEHFRLIRYDTRGHGGSPVPPGPYSIADLGRDMLALMDKLEIERASFCGLSIGGMVGMWLASEAPERIERLVLCCTSASLGPPSMWDERARVAREEGVGALEEAVIERWFTPPFLEAGGEGIERARRMLRNTPGEGYAGCCEAIRDMDLCENLARIQAPTLVIAGAEDPATPPDHGKFIWDSVPGARLHIIEQAAHIVTIEQPEKVTWKIITDLPPVTKEGSKR